MNTEEFFSLCAESLRAKILQRVSPVNYPPITRAEVVAASRRYIGTPYAHEGRGASGMDCIGLGIVVGQELGQVPLDLQKILPPYQPSSLPTLIDFFWEYVDEIPLAEVGTGDGYLLTHKPGYRLASHLAIRTGYGIIQLHWADTISKVAEHRIDEYHQQRLAKGWRYRGLII